MFTTAQIEILRTGYDRLPTIDPCSESYVRLISLLDSLPQANLKQLAAAKIKFVSMLARNRIK